MASPNIGRILNLTIPAVTSSLISPKLSVDLLRFMQVGFQCQFFSSFDSNSPLDLGSAHTESHEIDAGRHISLQLDAKQNGIVVAQVSHQFLVRKYGLSTARLKAYLERNLGSPNFDSFEKSQFAITLEDSRNFCQATANHNPIFFDEQFSQLNGLSHPVVALPLLLETIFTKYFDDYCTAMTLTLELIRPAMLDERLVIYYGKQQENSKTFLVLGKNENPIMMGYLS